MHRTSLRSLGRSFFLLILVSCLAVAQGPGTVTLGPFDTEAATLGQQNLGVQYMASTNTIMVTGRGNTPAGGVFTGNAPHTIYELDMAGNLIASWPQMTTASVWGHRDPASDGVKLIVGDEFGIYCFNPATGLYETTTTIQTSLGGLGYTFPLAVPVGTTTPIATARALAYNPAGNGGIGSLWVGDFGADLVEIDLMGNILTTHTANGTWSLYGLAWDSVRGVLWGSTSPNGGDLVEINPVTGQETGVRMTRFAPGTQGGLSIMQRPGAGSTTVPFTELLCLVQGAALPGLATDAIAGQRLDLYDPAPANRGHWDEAFLQNAVNAGTPSTAPEFFFDGDFLSWSYGVGAQSPGLSMTPALLLLSIGPEATSSSSTLGIPEIVAPNALSTPPSVGFTIVVGDGTGIGPLLAPTFPFGSNFLSDPPTAIGPWPAGILSLNDKIRLQALVFDGAIYPSGFIPLYATNTVEFTYFAPACILEGFEGIPIGAGNYPVGWSNGPGGTATDEWQPINVGTPSGSTGASAAFSGTNFMYCETSGLANTWPKTFVMDSAPLTTCGLASPMLTFSYHMWGGTMGTLMVEDLDASGNPISTLFTISGDQGNQWLAASVPVVPDASGNVTLRFTMTTPAGNNSWMSDACIDDVAIR